MQARSSSQEAAATRSLSDEKVEFFVASNLIKGINVNVKQSSVIKIDANDRIARRLSELAEQIKEEEPEAINEGFSEGLDAEVVEKLVSDRTDEDVDKGPEVSEELAMAMINEAKENAETILSEARAEAELLKEEARKQGHEEGFRKGESEARKAEEEKYRKKLAELEKKEKALELEYKKKSEELEPALVEKLSDIYAKVCGIRLENDRETINYLLHRALTNIDGSRNYIIHVSAVDYDNVQASKEELAKGTGVLPDRFEVVEDMTLGANDCLIESESGIWDCSLGTQLEMLSAELKILSYTPGGDE
ncbi:MAG: hypothetical protein K5987_00465 [Lachnospiraceae bacterium]|nr:hypothetical protein [Lachnospiraceae bacterium]